MYKIATQFFTSIKNILSLLIATLLIGLLYVLYLETSHSANLNNHFFGASFVTIPALSFFLFYFNTLFRNNYFRFLKINVRTASFFRYSFYIIFFLTSVLTIVSLFIYFILNWVYIEGFSLSSLDIKNAIYLFVFNLLLCSLSFLINSFTTSFWAFFAIIFYFFFEDFLVLFLKNNNLLFSDYLPQKSLIDIFRSTDIHFIYIVPFIYIGALALFIYKKNYRLL